MAVIQARKHTQVSAIGAALGLVAPVGPGVERSASLSLIGIGPGAWLAVREAASPEWIGTLAHSLEGLASVTEQTAAYVVLRLTGERARVLLQRGVAIDLDPVSFRTGMSAVTTMAHIGILLWQINDAPTYDLACYRSYSASLHRWIDAASAAL